MFDRAEQSLLTDWWFTVDRTILFLSIFLLAIGVLVSLAASPPIAIHRGLPHFFFTFRHVIFGSFALCLMVGLSMMGLKGLRRLSLWGFVFCIGVIIYVLIFGPEVNGAKRWLKIGKASFQPSEVLKPCLIILVSWALARKLEAPKSYALLLGVGLYLLTVMLLIWQPDFGQTILVTVTCGTILFLSGLSFGLLLFLIAGSFTLLWGAYKLLPHVAARIDAFIGLAAKNYQATRAQDIFSNAGWFGRGPGEGNLFVQHLPDAHNDFLFSAIAVEYGIVLCLFVAALYGLIVLKIFWRSFYISNHFCRIAAVGLATLFALQATIHMSVNLGLIPTKGMTLPFLSYGGSSTIATGVLLGMILSLTRKRPYYDD